MSRLKKSLRTGEDIFAFSVLILLTLFPIIEIVARSLFNTGLHGSFRYIQHLVVWATFAGGMITSREERHLALSAGYDVLPDRVKRWIAVFIQFVAVSVLTTLSWTSVSFLLLGFDPQSLIGIIPIRLAVMIVPIGYIIMTYRFIFHSSVKPSYRWIPAIGILVGSFFAINSIINILFFVVDDFGEIFWTLSDLAYSVAVAAKIPIIILLIGAAALGAPI